MAGSLLFPPTGRLERDQPHGRLGQDRAFFVLVHFLPRLDLALAAPATEADVVVEFADADAGVFGAHGFFSHRDNTVGANAFAKKCSGKKGCVGLMGLLRMNSLAQDLNSSHIVATATHCLPRIFVVRRLIFQFRLFIALIEQ